MQSFFVFGGGGTKAKFKSKLSLLTPPADSEFQMKLLRI